MARETYGIPHTFERSTCQYYEMIMWSHEQSLQVVHEKLAAMIQPKVSSSIVTVQQERDEKLNAFASRIYKRLKCEGIFGKG